MESSARSTSCPKPLHPPKNRARHSFYFNLSEYADRRFWLSLKSKGLNITDQGVSLKTSKRYDREDYIDSTQRCVSINSHRFFAIQFLISPYRGFIKAMGAASFGTSDSNMSTPSNSSTSLPPKRQDSASSIPGVGDEKEKEKKGRFGMRRAFSGSKS